MRIDLYGKLKMNDNGEYIIDKTNLTKVLKKYIIVSILSYLLQSNRKPEHCLNLKANYILIKTISVFGVGM